MRLKPIFTSRPQISTIIYILIIAILTSVTILTGTILSSNTVSADDNTSVVDQINITVPVSCTISGTGMNTHNANINNGLYEDDIGSTTLHAFCNDNEGFAIYAAGYTGNEVGGTNSNKLVGTNASGNAAIESGIATAAGNPDISNWAMKLAISQDSGDTTDTNAFMIDSAPNVSLPSQAEQGATSAPFTQYHVVPNEYTKVAHKNSGTDMTDTTGGVKLTTTYAAYISKTQAADTYSGQVIYTLVHPASAATPVIPKRIGINYNANGSSFTGSATTNNVVYVAEPMYIATTPLIAKSPNVADDGTKNTAYASDANVLTPITATGATKMKVVVQYGVSAGTGLLVAPEYWNGDGLPSTYEMISDGNNNAFNTATYIFDGDSITMYMENFAGSTPTTDYDYGFWAQVYPIYAAEQSGTEASDEFATFVAGTGTYATTTDWYGSWYGDINGEHYDFMNEAEVTSFLSENMSTLSGATIDLYRGLTFTEAYTRANKSQDGGYYKQQELTKSMCNTIAITQNQTLKDVRDNNTYMVGKLKDGNCWMLDNLALDPTDATTAANMNESNTNATAAAINNLLNGGSSITGWSSVEVSEGINSFTAPEIYNNAKDDLVTSYGPASTNGQAKVGIYYNFCAASAGTYCYKEGQGIDMPDTLIDASQDLCPANWRMPTGGYYGEYYALAQRYGSDATNISSLQYNLSTPLSGLFFDGIQGLDNSGGFWSSSSYIDENILNDMSYMYGLYVSSGMVSIEPNYRNDGEPMRCIVGV